MHRSMFLGSALSGLSVALAMAAPVSPVTEDHHRQHERRRSPKVSKTYPPGGSTRERERRLNKA